MLFGDCYISSCTLKRNYSTQGHSLPQPSFTILITSNGNINVPKNVLYAKIYLMRYISETLLYFSLRCFPRQYISEIWQEMDA